jgi:hypothetical protein
MKKFFVSKEKSLKGSATGQKKPILPLLLVYATRTLPTPLHFFGANERKLYYL